MAQVFKVLGQSAPVAGTLTPLYTVPSVSMAVVSTITVCNRLPAPAHFRIAVAVAGVADAPANYVAFDKPIAPRDTVALTLGITLNGTDVLQVQTFDGLLTFAAFGSEITN